MITSSDLTPIGHLISSVKTLPGSDIPTGYNKMRRAQLIKMLRDAGVDLEREDAPKEEYVRLVEIAANQGYFKGKPKHDPQSEEAQMAFAMKERFGDNWMDKLAKVLDEDPAPIQEIVAEDPVGEKMPERLESMSWNDIRKYATALGIQIHGMTRHAVEAAIRGTEETNAA